MVRSSLVEHHQLPHAPGVGAVPPSGDLAVRLGEKPVEFFVSIKPLIRTVHMSVNVVHFDGVAIKTSRTKLPHPNGGDVGMKLSSATSRT